MFDAATYKSIIPFPGNPVLIGVRNEPDYENHHPIPNDEATGSPTFSNQIQCCICYDTAQLL